MSEKNVLLEVKGLKKYFPIKGGIFGKKVLKHVKAVEDVSFSVYQGETFGIVGESGCGKSTTGRAILRLLEPTEGQVLFDGVDLANLSTKEMRKKRKDLQIVFQDPFASLNPRMKISKTIEEPMNIFDIHDEKERKIEVRKLMERVGLKPEYVNRYPHEFSGGQRQRIGIARALSVQPKLIIADEPVSALDVSVQSQVLNLMKELQREYGLTYVFISHDLSVVKHLCDRIGVMYLGNMIELSNKTDLYEEPLHPYTKALLSAVPTPSLKEKRERIILKGSVPSPSNPPSGCVFHTRCTDCMDICKVEKPKFQEVKKGRFVACHLYQ
ncbi:ABC transporter ATP-binding protein [Halalkalibacterium ligniniphilum]|uniref:ABC transporter ATP-binding protein n=1 Tax=Halalkalibacterium ligniniphilum TaxID=1134413 RepID=UPI00034D21E5|nr:dipeptide ABC transporter ATP-binding protein [Halalkalibacterium ligniniphilum]